MSLSSDDLEKSKIYRDILENKIRKNLKDLDMTCLDSLLILIQGFNFMCQSYQEKHGSTGLRKLFEELAEWESNIIGCCFDLCLPLNEYLLKLMKEGLNE